LKNLDSTGSDTHASRRTGQQTGVQEDAGFITRPSAPFWDSRFRESSRQSSTNWRKDALEGSAMLLLLLQLRERR
jgi:hypothetical protein